ncbi:hypothetical protein POM88_000869 [Heracleum sosnowskyi]|uniref:RNase H type-1 domain-containing protein n=1 Tax=Heracleum sosnowskyi TaxID=360622 RepID=A0AAD8JCZ7_9APIA|nr:hypothetical protein POM88_000869 [Heracleum sosnowskyi]
MGRLVEEFGKYSSHIYQIPVARQARSSQTWQAPPDGMIKVNADASFSDEGWIGMDAVARDHVGKIISEASRRVRAWRPAEIAEGKAMLLAIKLAKIQGCKDVSLSQRDSSVVAHQLAKTIPFGVKQIWEKYCSPEISCKVLKDKLLLDQ